MCIRDRYDASDVLKCSVSFNFIRYIMEPNTSLVTTQGILNRRDPTMGMNDLIRSIQDGQA